MITDSYRFSRLWIALIAVLATLTVVWGVNRPPAVIEATMDDVRAEANAGGYRLIDIEELSKLYQSRRDQIRLIDTRQEWEYRSGHIAGAVVFPMEPTWRARWLKKNDLKAFLGQDSGKNFVFY